MLSYDRSKRLLGALPPKDEGPELAGRGLITRGSGPFNYLVVVGCGQLAGRISAGQVQGSLGL